MLLCQFCAKHDNYRPVEPAYRLEILDFLYGLFGYRPHRCIVCDTYIHLRVEKVDWIGILILLFLILIIVVGVILPTLLS